MMLTAKADAILKTLDPLIGVAGKEADVTFIVQEDLIKASVMDESHAAICFLNVDVLEGLSTEIIDDYVYNIDEEVTVNIDTLVAALKMFSGQKVNVSFETNIVIVECETGKRTIRVSKPVKTLKDVAFSASAEILADAKNLKRIAGLDSISDSMFFDLRQGKLSIGCSSDNQSAEIYIDTDVHTSLRSYYSSALVASIVRRIHSDSVTICLTEDEPLGLLFKYECADYRTFVAPRIDKL